MTVEEAAARRPADANAASLAPWIAEIEAACGALAGEIVEARQQLQDLPIPARPTTQWVAQPGDAGDPERRRQIAEREQAESVLRSRIDALQANERALNTMRSSALRELSAVQRLAAWDELTAATRSANALGEQISVGRRDRVAAADLASIEARLADALRRRRLAWLRWHLEFGAQNAPELFHCSEA
jgi:hypothetical protein